jgi:hypothetical protein
MGNVPTTAISTTNNRYNILKLRRLAIARYAAPRSIEHERETHANHGPEEPSSTISQASTQVDNSPRTTTSLPTSPLFTASSQVLPEPPESRCPSNPSSPDHRGTCITTTQRRHPTMPLTASLSGLLSAQGTRQQTGYRIISKPLCRPLQCNSSTHRNITPSTARFAPAIPWLHHQRFDDAVNIEKCLRRSPGMNECLIRD